MLRVNNPALAIIHAFGRRPYTTRGVQPGAEAFGRETGDKRRGCLPIGTIRAIGIDSRWFERRATERGYSPASVTVLCGARLAAAGDVIRRANPASGVFKLKPIGGDPLFRGQILHDLIRLRVGAELRRQGHVDAHALANHLPNSVIDAAINSAPEAKAIGDGTHPILDAFFAFIESPTGQAIIAALIKALLGGL